MSFSTSYVTSLGLKVHSCNMRLIFLTHSIFRKITPGYLFKTGLSDLLIILIYIERMTKNLGRVFHLTLVVSEAMGTFGIMELNKKK